MATNVVSQVTNKLPDGRVIVATIQPRADGGWVVTHQDVSERETLNAQLARQNELLKQREEELKAQNERFNAAINNMSQGMSLFDSEQRVVFANRRFAEIYGLAPEEVRPGTTLRQILTARAAQEASTTTSMPPSSSRRASPASARRCRTSCSWRTDGSSPSCADR